MDKAHLSRYTVTAPAIFDEPVHTWDLHIPYSWAPSWYDVCEGYDLATDGPDHDPAQCEHMIMSPYGLTEWDSFDEAWKFLTDVVESLQVHRPVDERAHMPKPPLGYRWEIEVEPDAFGSVYPYGYVMARLIPNRWSSLNPRARRGFGTRYAGTRADAYREIVRFAWVGEDVRADIDRLDREAGYPVREVWR